MFIKLISILFYIYMGASFLAYAWSSGFFVTNFIMFYY
jgi:hypothetical protein